MNSILSVIGATLLLLIVSCTSPIEFYVSPGGDDQNPGTEAEPFQTLERAKQAVKEQLSERPSRQLVVNVKGGTYLLSNPVFFTAEDSGTVRFPVIYRAVEGEEPVFTGSRELKNWKMMNTPDKSGLLSPDASGKIYVTDLKAAGVEDFGDPTEIGRRPELFCNGQLQQLARWPDEGFVRAGRSLGATELPLTYTREPGTREGVFEYLNSRQNRWAKEKDVRLGGYWYWDWSDEFQTVEKVDTLVRTISLRNPYHHYGYKDSLRYFGLNLFCELDRPGEWYLDRSDGLLYWYPPKDVDPEKAAVTLSVFGAPYMVEMQNCSNVSLQGLTFREGRGSAVLVREGTNCVLAGCRFERFGRDGIHIEGGSGHGISGCLLNTFGCSGIHIKGGDRKTLTPAGHFVEHTVVENFSLFKRTYEPAVHADGCGIRISNNRFRYSSSSAMRLEGNDMLIEYNEVSHVVNESDDQGGADIFYNPSYRGILFRYNRWSDILGGTRHGAAGVRLDDMISGVTIFGNVFERCGSLNFGGVQIHGGKDNLVENNIFSECFAAVSFSPWGEKRWLEQLDSPVIRKKIYEDVDILSEPYLTKYPELKNIRENPDVNTIKDNLVIDCKNLFARDNGRQILENNTVAKKDGKTIEEFCTPEVLKGYGLQRIPVEDIGPKLNPWINKTKLN
ncbi:MAG: right-handed parallel beta-helix repeat-containing protein [Mangrovibacterium sp.]|nr:right-handed parallel beta-helix repeat-containing protein [Mangrovibacterium sp.]